MTHPRSSPTGRTRSAHSDKGRGGSSHSVGGSGASGGPSSASGGTSGPAGDLITKKLAARPVTKSLRTHEASEGIGSKVRRCIGNRAVRCLPPFVICEHFKMDEMGRPPHPARGAQKITYVLSGKVKIEYSPSNSLELGPGDVTSLMVGKGVIRSVKAMEYDPDNDNSNNDDEDDDRRDQVNGERSSASNEDTNANSNDDAANDAPNPSTEDSFTAQLMQASSSGMPTFERHHRSRTSASGIQIYMDVPEPFKRNDPSHLNLCHSDVLGCEPSPGVHVRILTGSAFGHKADQMLTATPALVLDCVMQPGSRVELPVKSDWNAFAYVIKGLAHIQGEKAQKHQYVEFMRSFRGPDGGQSQPQPQGRPNKAKQQVSKSSKSASSSSSHSSAEEQASGKSGSKSAEDQTYVTITVDDHAKSFARVLFCAAKPLCQPIYRQGPFVDVSMNWIHQAFDDYSERKNGFESGQWWNNHAPKPNAALRDEYDVPPLSTATNPTKCAPKGRRGRTAATSAGSASSSAAEASTSADEQDSGMPASSDERDSSHEPNNGKSDEDDNGAPYNPCEKEDGSENCSECDSKGCDSKGGSGSGSSGNGGHSGRGKASYPNAFPPGSVNPASHATEFNNVDCVEEQQEQKVPRRDAGENANAAPHDTKRDTKRDAAERDSSEDPGPPPKKR